MINIYQSILRLPFNVVHFNIYSNSPTHHLDTHKLPSKTVSQKMTYLHPFDHMNILRLCTTIPEFIIPSLSLPRLTLSVQTVPLIVRSIIHTNALERIFVFSFQKF